MSRDFKKIKSESERKTHFPTKLKFFDKGVSALYSTCNNTLDDIFLT